LTQTGVYSNGVQYWIVSPICVDTGAGSFYNFKYSFVYGCVGGSASGTVYASPVFNGFVVNFTNTGVGCVVGNRIPYWTTPAFVDYKGDAYVSYNTSTVSEVRVFSNEIAVIDLNHMCSSGLTYTSFSGDAGPVNLTYTMGSVPSVSFYTNYSTFSFVCVGLLSYSISVQCWDPWGPKYTNYFCSANITACSALLFGSRIWYPVFSGGVMIVEKEVKVLVNQYFAVPIETIKYVTVVELEPCNSTCPVCNSTAVECSNEAVVINNNYYTSDEVDMTFNYVFLVLGIASFVPSVWCFLKKRHSNY